MCCVSVDVDECVVCMWMSMLCECVCGKVCCISVDEFGV